MVGPRGGRVAFWPPGALPNEVHLPGRLPSLPLWQVALFSLSRYEMSGGPADARQFDLAPDGGRFIFLTAGTRVQTSNDEPFNSLIFVENWFEELKARVPAPCP